jgi:hypothetical protein
MTEPTTEEKIQLLVRSVLEAVDARLDAVRHELAHFSSEVERRHHEVLESVAALEARVATMDGHDQLAAEVNRLHEAVESLRRAGSAPAVVETLTVAAAMPAPTPESLHAPEPAVTTGSHRISKEDLDEISRPLVTHITTQVPVVPDPHDHHEPLPHRPVTVPPSVAPRFGTMTNGDTPPTPSGDDPIDLDQLTSLLNERLGHLSLPVRPD